MFNGQPVALVLAEDWETARFAASLVGSNTQQEPHVTDLHAQRDKAFVVEKPEKPRGDAEKAFAAADVRHEAEYFIPTEHHNPMELFASTAIWDGDGKLTVYDKTQGVQNVQRYLCGVFDMKPDEVRVMSPYMGGGFGAGLRPQYQVVLAVLAARALKRSVRLVLTRRRCMGSAIGRRPSNALRSAPRPTARSTPITHEAIAVTSQFEEFSRNDTGWAATALQEPQREIRAPAGAARRSDAPPTCARRAPRPASMRSNARWTSSPSRSRSIRWSCGCAAIPTATRTQDVPYTSKQLRECYRQGAEAFGWDKRKPEPRSMRDGSELVGWGMATGVWEALQMPAAVRIVLTANGHAEVALRASDIGTGTYTIMAQVAADMLGLPIDNISVKLGDSTLPQCAGRGRIVDRGLGVPCDCDTAREVRKELLKLGKRMKDSPLAGASVDDVALVGRQDRQQAGREPRGFDRERDAARQCRSHRPARKPTVSRKTSTHARNTHSAVFAEVKVDEELGVIRVTRVVNAVAAGRILNPKTAHSQMMGGVVWGIGMALHEETLFDHQFGRVMNANIAEYHVPVNADVHDIEVIFVDEPDEIINPLGIKGLGEIGIVGVAAAIANAVYHATGKRVRDLPITLDKVIQFD